MPDAWYKLELLVHRTQHTVHSTQYTVHSTQYTVHSTQYTVHILLSSNGRAACHDEKVGVSWSLIDTQYTVDTLGTQYTVLGTHGTPSEANSDGVLLLKRRIVCPAAPQLEETRLAGRFC
jgi:hypothetical protein